MLDDELAGLRPSGPADLRELHAVLLRAATLGGDPPFASLATVAELIAPLPGQAVAAIGPRPRVAFRLLLAGSLDAAWAVLIDNAKRLPLLTKVEPPNVFAELPGFRDPRFGAPDDCYDITAGITLRHQLDEVAVSGTLLTFGGWASLDPLLTGPQEHVRLIASNGDVEVSAVGRRLRRPERRVWAGWSAQLDLAELASVEGEWSFVLTLDHDGVTRRAAVGNNASELARSALNSAVRIGARTVRWKPERDGWRLQVG